MSRSAAASPARGLFGAPLSFSGGYLQRSQLPLVSLTLLLPFLIFYEAGTWYFASGRVRAVTLLRDFFNLFHASGRFLPALTVAMVLLCWHIARRDAWKFDLQTPLLMLLESLILSLPLIALAGRYGFNSTPPNPLGTHVVASIGAGIYEELVFRLMAFSLLSLILVDFLKVEETWAILLIVCISAVLFSAYHYLGKETFLLQTFLFRTAGGIYFGLIFVTRGFGITAGTHASYDILMFLISAWPHTP